MSPGRHLRALRSQAGLTQARLAEASGVSRALISAIESGRHLPRVDAALALARVLGTSAEQLFTPSAEAPVDALTGRPPAPGTPVRLGFVGHQPVTIAAQHGDNGWQSIDWVSDDDALAVRREPGVVVAGCEPALALLERLLREKGTRALAIASTSATALRSLAAGRLHAAAVHFPEGDAPDRDDATLVRLRLARWRVGLAAPKGSPRGWWQSVLAGRAELIQREPDAAAQQAFDRARSAPRRPIEGPRVDSHIAASRQCVASGLPAVTIEPAASAAGADFHALETHDVELWVRAERIDEAPVRRLVDLLTTADFRRTLECVGGYDLSQSGTSVQ